MARICSPDRKWLALVIVLLLTGAGASSPEHDARVRAAALCQREDWLAAEPLLRDALVRFQGNETDDFWEMRLFYAEALTGLSKYDAASVVLAPDPPPRLAHSSIAVRRLLMQAILSFRKQSSPELLLKKAESLARTYQPALLAEVFADRVNIEVVQHDYAAAERHAREALRLARKHHQPRMELKTLGAVARMRTWQERYDEAIDANRRALALAEAASMLSKIEKIQGNLGWAYAQFGDFDSATEYLEKALTGAERIGASFDIVLWLNNLGDIAVSNRDYARALRYYQRATPVARKTSHRDLGEFMANTASALLELGDTAGAVKANQEAQALIDPKDKDLSQHLRAVMIDARIDAKVGHIDSAIAIAQQVMAAAKTKSDQWEAEARLAEFYVAANNPSDADKHFRQAIDTAADARSAIKNEELRLSFGALVREVNEAYVQFLLDGGHPVEALEAAESSRAQTLDEALGPEDSTRRFDPKRVARERGAVILSYWLTPKQSYVWIITGSSIDVEKLPPAKAIEAVVDASSGEIQALRSRESSRAASKLYSMIVPKALARMAMPAGARVIVVPDGRLHSFNLETLLNPSSHRYWIEDVTVETANSLDLLDAVRDTGGSGSMLLVGDPLSQDREFPRLANAADEIDRVKRHFPRGCTILQGAQATPRAYELANAGRFGFIHFVAHGTATRQRPLESAVVLARDDDTNKLYARDILKHPLRARLVTISSCHGAGKRAYTGEGLVGLAWAFLHAGAQQVIASLWEVNDSATPKLMDDLYGGIRAGRDPATSLRNAKLRLIHGGTIYQHPRYWAPFVLYSGS
jgi:CHAT domain-containing protein